jgi:hypothetical protein
VGSSKSLATSRTRTMKIVKDFEFLNGFELISWEQSVEKLVWDVCAWRIAAHEARAATGGVADRRASQMWPTVFWVTGLPVARFDLWCTVNSSSCIVISKKLTFRAFSIHS